MRKIGEFLVEHPWSMMLLGLFLFGIAANDTYESYTAAPPGGIYTIDWWTMLVGALAFFAGLILWIVQLNKK